MSRRPHPGLDRTRAREVLTAVLGHDPGPVEVVGEGTWSRCFGVTDDGRDLVVRLGATTEDFARDRAAAAFRSPTLPIPAVHALGGHGDVAYCLSDRVEGTPLEQLDAAGWAAVTPAVLALVDEVAAMARPAGGGYGPWGPTGHGTLPSWRSWLLGVADDDREPRLAGWRAGLADHPDLSRAVDAGLARLAVLAEAGEGRRQVVHGDLINRNVLAVGGRITGVLDWGCALDGDPALSVSELELWAPWHPGLASVDVRAEARRHLEATGGDVIDLDARVDAGAVYLALAGLCFGLATGGSPEDRARTLARLEHYLSH